MGWRALPRVGCGRRAPWRESCPLRSQARVPAGAIKAREMTRNQSTSSKQSLDDSSVVYKMIACHNGLKLRRRLRIVAAWHQSAIRGRNSRDCSSRGVPVIDRRWTNCCRPFTTSDASWRAANSAESGRGTHSRPLRSFMRRLSDSPAAVRNTIAVGHPHAPTCCGPRRMRRRIVDNEWASWSLPGVVCFGDSGAPTFIYDPSTRRQDDHVVAVASDSGDVCFSRDDRARVDTDAARDWVRRTIAQNNPTALERRPWPRRVGAWSGKTSSRSCQDETLWSSRSLAGLVKGRGAPTARRVREPRHATTDAHHPSVYPP